MTTPCSLLCLLAISLDFRPSPDIQKCSYCVQLRGLTQSCSKDPWDCAEWDPDSLIYCLSRDEQYWGRDALLKRSTRCISHSNLLNNQTLISELALIPHDTEYRCTFERAQECKCPDCFYERKPPVFEEIERMEEDSHHDSNKDMGKNLQEIAQQFNKLINEEENKDKSMGRTFVKIPTQKSKRNKQKHSIRIAETPLRRQIEQKELMEEEKHDNKTVKSIPFWPADFLYQFNGSLSSQICNIFLKLFLVFPLYLFLIEL
ncbi:hypothetical protein ACQ4LE_010289 [Meloidogyne hapla]